MLVLITGIPSSCSLHFSPLLPLPTPTQRTYGARICCDHPPIACSIQLAGFVNTRYCTLVNTSLIPMSFNLRVPADGWASEETHSRDNSLIDSNISDVGSTIMPSSREFDISPSTGTIAPQGELDIKVIRTDYSF